MATQSSILAWRIPVDRGAWRAAVHGVTKSPTRLKCPSTSGSSGKEFACQCGRRKIRGSDSWVGEIPWRKEWLPTPVFWLGKSHGQRSLVGYSPWDGKEWTEQLHIHTHTLSMNDQRVVQASLQKTSSRLTSAPKLMNVGQFFRRMNAVTAWMTFL